MGGLLLPFLGLRPSDPSVINIAGDLLLPFLGLRSSDPPVIKPYLGSFRENFLCLLPSDPPVVKA